MVINLDVGNTRINILRASMALVEHAYPWLLS